MTTPMPEIREDQSVATQSRNSLTLAKALGLLTVRKPVEVGVEAAVAHLRAELGENAELPEDDGQYYWVYIPTVAGGEQPMLIPEGEVLATCRVLAARHSPEMARMFEYRPGVIPA